MRVLVIGGGGREHALCWSIAASPLCEALFCAPGNAGIAEVATCLPVKADDFEGIVAACRDHDIGFVVVGPEAPLVAGLVDRLDEEGIKAFGPTARAAALEGSKVFMKDLCARHGVPTAAYATFDEPEAAKDYIRARGAPLVVKTDGLAAGKGVILARDVDEALAAVDRMMLADAFGGAGRRLVVEEFLVGEEASFFALCDGETVLPLAAAQDHKQVGEGDTGPNTGGMGAYSPVPAMTDRVTEEVMDSILRPTVAGLAAEGRPYKGVLFVGLMITEAGPRLLEFNVRFGDPECQALVPRLRSDLLPALVACADGVLSTLDLRWNPDAALVVVMAAEGYPGGYEKGSAIRGLEDAGAVDGVTVFHAGTTRGGDGLPRASGGRVLGVTALGRDVAEARERAYAAVDRVDWPRGFCRRDIGWRAIKTSARRVS